MGAEGLMTWIFATGAGGLLGGSVAKKSAAENKVAATYFIRPIDQVVPNVERQPFA